jgi:type II secretory pathway predicted ATPase ExeA
LTNSRMDSASPFAGILVGQPTLSHQLRMGTFAAYVAPTAMSRPVPRAERILS